MIIKHDFTFGTTPLFPDNFPKSFGEEVLQKIADYNNHHHGIIDNDFVKWALENKIPYNVVLWFIKDFSGQTDQELLWYIDTCLCHYTIYSDESSNCIKFRFKDETGKLNIDWHNDFVVAGVAFEGDQTPFDIDILFSSLNLQKTITDAKLKNIAEYNGEDIDRFVDILKSHKLEIILTTLKDCNVYLHWSTQSLLYYALVDIVDSVINVPVMLDAIKNAFYKYVLKDLDVFLKFLASYDYPNIKGDRIVEFCDELIDWIESLEPESEQDEFYLKTFRQSIKSSKKANQLIFLKNNVDNLLIENFVPVYGMRLGDFPNSTIHFDQCSIVEDNIKGYEEIFCDLKVPEYDFLTSTNNKWLQLSDFFWVDCGTTFFCQQK